MKNMLFAAVRLLLLTILWAAAAGALADGIEIAEFDTPQQERQYADLLRELRCLVCQNQTLAESRAPLAQDMRDVIGDMVRNHTDHEDIIGFMTARYGDFVLYRPPWRGRTFVLWLLPFTLAVAGLVWLRFFVRRQRCAELSDAERQRAAQLLRE